MRSFITLLVIALLLCCVATELFAQSIFIRRGNMSADALALEHKVKKLASYDTQMKTLNAALQDLADESQKFTRLAQRQGSYYALQRAFDPVIQRYKVVEYTIDNASDWKQGNPRMQDWRNLQDAFDQTYYDLYGYDLLDPYFGRHPDFAAVPVHPQIPYRVLHPESPNWSTPNREIYPSSPAPSFELPTPSSIRGQGNPQQF
ncbi:hypothetical protein C5Y96_13205 [Blastopirellula marina]|uniref:Uncharacterized protein n=1 Tax=Blastopirellula marina TaxID=124 RepID=A0A2S8FHB2_9BACT|nr:MULTISPECIES: hypothetical protein [Pirellulaceae]PQO31294.1 hypothetical protein C5Y96_13205 [Blastopirellula marina]RCS51688.1 hypothetical protein DTL36_13215 [Bremerella cremea]